VNIGPVVSAENRLTHENCVACSRGSAYFVEHIRIYWTDFCNIFTIWKSALGADDGSLPYFPISQGTLPWQPNHLWTSGTTRPKNWRILLNISGYTEPIFALFSPYESSLCTDDGSVLFSKFGQLPSSNLGVYAVKTCNFCRHAPAILGPSSRWRLEMDWKIAILISAEQSANIFVHHIEIWWDSVQ